ncbi:hypothetical protein NC652_019406 [Populus alba x Populus x berolinensis]|nr:hypothetical protein NC652_019406 [Populus alba x Populus x berolinensis]
MTVAISAAALATALLLDLLFWLDNLKSCLFPMLIKVAVGSFNVMAFDRELEFSLTTAVFYIWGNEANLECEYELFCFLY